MRGDPNRHGMRGGTRKGEEGIARCPSCSQNAHDEAVLVRCAQWETKQAPPSCVEMTEDTK